MEREMESIILGMVYRLLKGSILSLLTPQPQTLNQKLRGFARAAGFGFSRVKGLGFRSQGLGFRCDLGSMV